MQFPKLERIKFFDMSQKLHNLCPLTIVALTQPIMSMQIFVTYQVPDGQTHVLEDGSTTKKPKEHSMQVN